MSGGTNDTATASAGTPIAPSCLHSAYDLLSTAGLGALGLAAAAALPATRVAPETAAAFLYTQAIEGQASPHPASLMQTPAMLPAPAEAAEGPSPPAATVAPFADILPIDVEAIQRRADAFFEQLAGLSAQLSEGRVIEKLAPWIMAATLAAWEWTRLRRMRAPAAANAEDDYGPGPFAFLAGDEA